MLINLAINHTVVVETKDDVTYYNAASPDELALVNGAKFFGVTFIDRNETNQVTVDYRGE